MTYNTLSISEISKNPTNQDKIVRYLAEGILRSIFIDKLFKIVGKEINQLFMYIHFLWQKRPIQLFF